MIGRVSQAEKAQLMLSSADRTGISVHRRKRAIPGRRSTRHLSQSITAPPRESIHHDSDRAEVSTVDSRLKHIKNDKSQTQQVDEPYKAFVCNVRGCEKRFRRSEHLRRHIRSLHTCEKPYICTVCKRDFSRTDNLAQHMKVHGGGTASSSGVVTGQSARRPGPSSSATCLPKGSDSRLKAESDLREGIQTKTGLGTKVDFQPHDWLRTACETVSMPGKASAARRKAAVEATVRIRKGSLSIANDSAASAVSSSSSSSSKIATTASKIIVIKTSPVKQRIRMRNPVDAEFQ